MNGAEFKERRERLLLTQAGVSERLKVSPATVRNWEAETTAIPTAVEMLWEVWEHRFQQESPHFGPVTLVYTDGPMFVDPQGPRRPLAMMHQEPFVTNAGALARVCALWDRPGFNSPLILKPTGDLLWNAVQLAKVADKSDTYAPIVPVMVRKLSTYVRTYSARYLRSGPRLSSSEKAEARQREIEVKADKLDILAAADTHSSIDSHPAETVLDRLHVLGMSPPGDMVNGIFHAYEARRMRWPAT